MSGDLKKSPITWRDRVGPGVWDKVVAGGRSGTVDNQASADLSPEVLVGRIAAMEQFLARRDFFRDFRAEVEEADKSKGVIQSIISDDSTDYYGTVIAPGAFEDSLPRFRDKGVVLWMHGIELLRGHKPVGNPVDGYPQYVGKGKRLLRARTKFDMLDPFASEVFRMYRDGVMKDWSVGFRIPKDGWAEEPIREDQTSITIWTATLTEYSAVHVGANPNVETEKIQGLVRIALGGSPAPPPLTFELDDEDEELRGALKPHKTDLAPEDTPWRLTTKEQNELPNEAFSWIDKDYLSGKSEDKSLRKLPHHTKDMKCVWRAVAAAMAVLRGARGGANIPDKDRAAVYRHLAGHYKQFDKEVPPPPGQKAADEEEPSERELEEVMGREIGPTGGDSMGRVVVPAPDPALTNELARLRAEIEEVARRARELEIDRTTTRKAADLIERLVVTYGGKR